MLGQRAIGACAVALAALLVAGCVPADTSNAPLPDNPPFAGVADADWKHPSMTEGSVRLAAALVALGGGGQDVVVSPVGLQLLMSVLREGATGATATQLEEVLGLPDSGSQAVADLRAVLGEFDGDLSAVTAAQPPQTPVLRLADGLFVHPTGKVHQQFLNRVDAFHRADVIEKGVVGPAGKTALDAWIGEQTGGLVAVAPTEPVEGTRLVALDTAVFAATWKTPFPMEGTADRPWTLLDATQVPVRTMAQNLATAYVAGDGWQAVELPYTEGFVMRLALTDTGRPPDWSAVGDALAAAGQTAVHVELPSWRTDSSLSVLGTLQALGVAAITRPGHLEGMFDGAVATEVAQAASLTVAEGGTVSAAVAPADDAAAAPAEAAATILFNRPFEYQVVHEATGLVVFAGALVDPR